MENETKAVLESFSKLNNELINQKRELERVQAQLKRTSRQRQMAIYTVAHDLRSPIASVAGYLEILSMTEISDEAKLYMQKVNSSLGFLNSLVSSLAEFAAIDGGKVALKKEECDLRKIVENSIANLQAAKTSESILIRCESSDSNYVFCGDAFQMQRAVNNIVGNALRFAPNRSCVEISLSALPDALTFSCRDHGPGVSPEAIDQVFEPFFRAPNQGIGGLGLGLAIVDEIVKAHGGRVRAANSDSGGAIFSFEIPRNRIG